MRMIIGLEMAALLGWLAWLGIAVARTGGLGTLRTHVLVGMAVTLWNLFIQSMLLFMWISLTRQVREQTAHRLDAVPFVQIIQRVRNRLFPWMVLGLVGWMIPPVTGMMRVVGQGPASLHQWSAWGIVAWTGWLVAAELLGGLRLIFAMGQIDRILQRAGEQGETSQ